MSNNVYEILGFYNDPKTFVLGARSAINKAQKKLISKSTDALLNIARLCNSTEETKPKPAASEAAYMKFVKLYKNLEAEDFSSREIRALTYCMHQFSNKEMFHSFAKLLCLQWRDRYFNGLLFFLLNSWDSTDPECLQQIIDVFQTKIALYQGKKDKFLLLKKNAKYLQNNGAEMLGMALRKFDAGQTESCSLLSVPSVYWGLNTGKIDQEYYSKVITAYFGRDAIKKLDLLRKVLQEHTYENTAKRIIPSMILQNKGGINTEMQDYIRSIAVGMIGNPEHQSKWTMRYGTPEEKQNLEEARTILNEWLKKKFITIFFEICINEPQRKQYWLDHIDMIEDLEVWCTRTTMSFLMEDNKIADMLSTKVNVLTHEGDRNQSALFLYIGNYVFVEFSDVGCLYMFNNTSAFGNIITSRRFMYFDEIKRMKVDTIQDFYLKYKEGKIPHLSGWEKTLEKWMKFHHIVF